VAFVDEPEYRPPTTIRLQDVTDRALLVELQRRLACDLGGQEGRS
jgi:hypothetical protein